MVISAKVSFVALATLVSGVSMMLPAIIGDIHDEHDVARIFFYQGIMTIVLGLFLGIATFRSHLQSSIRHDILEMASIFLLLPMILACPFFTAVEDFSLIDAYFEAVSCLTTTGISLLPDHFDGAKAIHFWRGFIAWIGGLVVWILASIVIKHFGLNLLEQLSRASGSGHTAANLGIFAEDETPIIQRTFPLILFYLAATLILCGLLFWLEQDLLKSGLMAMATLSTSGIVLAHGTDSISIWSEVVVASFLVLAISRLFMLSRGVQTAVRSLPTDPEVHLAGLILLIVIVLALVHDGPGLINTYNVSGVPQIIQLAWGKFFTFLSFLTTAGFESQFWSGREPAPASSLISMLLIILVVVGGGIGTNAGGIKLWRLRIFLKHIGDEVFAMLYPSGVLKDRQTKSSTPRSGWEDAWIMFTLFFVMIVLLSLILAAEGFAFDLALTASIAILSTAGPLVDVLYEGQVFAWQEVTPITKIILSLGMVIGRLEAVLLLFMLSPGFIKR